MCNVKSRHDSQRDHALRKPLETVVGSFVGDAELVKKIVEDVLSTLDAQNIISYTVHNNINLLTPFGRVLSLLLERPNLTVREMSTFLGVTEANINKAISKLMSENLVLRTKKNGRYEYRANPDTASEHSDLRRLIAMIILLT